MNSRPSIHQHIHLVLMKTYHPPCGIRITAYCLPNIPAFTAIQSPFTDRHLPLRGMVLI